MKFHCPKKDSEEWRKIFLLRPRRVSETSCRWLCFVERQSEWDKDWYVPGYYIRYRNIGSIEYHEFLSPFP